MSIQGFARRRAVLGDSPRLHPSPPKRVPSPEEALRAALRTERMCGDAWVHHPHRKVLRDLLAAGLVEEYRVTDRPDATVYFRLTDAGRLAAVAS